MGIGPDTLLRHVTRSRATTIASLHEPKPNAVVSVLRFSAKSLFLIPFSYFVNFQFLFARQLMLGFLVALVSGVVIALVVLIAIADGEGGHEHEH